MRKIYSCLGVLAMLLIICLASCSGDSKMTELMQRIPADMDVVAVGNVKTIIESAGGSIEENKIKLPSFIADEIPSSSSSDFDEFNSFLKKSGIDPDVCAVITNYNSPVPVVIFALADKKKFINAIEDEGFREKDDDNSTLLYSKKVYESSIPDYDDYGYIAINGSYAYWIERVWENSKFKPLQAIKRIIEDASDAPYSKTSFADYITSGNAAGASFKIPRELRQEMKQLGMPTSIANMYDGVICMKGSLDGDIMTIDAKWFDEDGKPKNPKDVADNLDLTAKINPESLVYLDKDENMVFALSLKNIDWDLYLDRVSESNGMSRSDRTALSMAKSYLEKIDGTIAIGFGLTNGVESVFNLDIEHDVLNQMAFTIVVETKEGKAKGMVNDLAGFLESVQVPVDNSSKGFSVDIPREDGSIYVEYDTNHIILSNKRIKKNNDNDAVKSFDFKNHLAAINIRINKSNKLMQDLDIKNDVQGSIATVIATDDMGSSMRLKVDGGNSEGIIAKLARIILDIKSQSKSLEARYTEHRRAVRGYGDYYDYDEVIVEEVPVDVWDDTDSVAVAVDW